jgi:hypothetical protein
MRLIAFAVAGLVTAGAGVASAQPMWGPEGGRFYGPERSPRWQRDIGPLDPQRVAYVVESMGLDPVGPPLQTGNLVVQRAADEFGRIVRVTVNLNNGRVVSVVPLGAPPSVNGGPYAAQRPYGPGPYAPSPYARQAPQSDDDEEFAPPGSMMAPRADLPPAPSYGPGPRADLPPAPSYVPGPGAAPPPRSAAATPYPTPAYPANPYAAAPPKGETHKPATKSATATPTQPPKPRKRPEGVEAAKSAEPGSVAPVKPAPAPGAAPAAPSTAMPPVAPLE